MNIDLKGFQLVSVAELTGHCRWASLEVGAGRDAQAVVLSAPTGSGKTIIATALMESLLEGDESGEGDSRTTFLWITDQPELNEQTRRKVLATSSVFGPDRVVTLDGTFDQETFDAGTLYFLNVQKLREGSLLTTRGDQRTYTLWETISNTAEMRPTTFWVILDEAHKGMAETLTARRQAQTTVQKFIKGSNGQLPPIPLVLGISATPERFLSLLEGAGSRTIRSEDVPPEEVRASGLLKETILLYHPDESQPADITLLDAAASTLRDYEQRWAEYHNQAQSGDVVRPILVVQVEDASKSRPLTQTDIRAVLRTLEEQLGPLDGEAIAHAFQEGGAIEIDGRTIPYCPPADIQDDPNLRAVIFKTSLNTGWDCPRAEVMMSFRKAVDHTLIAQLVGRMVRTPLNRRIDTDESLNTVSLFLPHYDRAGLDSILHKLQNPDVSELPPVRVERGEDALSLDRNPELISCFAAVEQVPTYIVTAVRKTTNLRRMMKLARLLANDDIEPHSISEARANVVAILEEEAARLKGTDSFENVVRESGVIDLRGVEYSYGVGPSAESNRQVPVSQDNVDDLFAEAGRKIGEGLHKAYWKARSEADPPAAKRIAKLELFALVHDRQTMERLEREAGERLRDWQARHQAEINALPPDRQDGYHQVRQTAMTPEPHPMALPYAIQGRKTATSTWKQHLFANDEFLFPYDFKSGWEPKVLVTEMERSDFVGFLRNEDRKKWALCVPYKLGGIDKPMYPDFLIFREHDGQVVIDILDPHAPSLDDWWQKAVGLAEYAARHGNLFGRIELITVEGDEIIRLDLQDEDRRNRVRGVRSNDHLRDILNNP
jgi:type III restriction enzyme